jgi:hypothetical protein
VKKWFVATLILKCEIEGESTIPGEWTCIQQIHLIREATREGAYEKAMRIGISEELSYANVEGNKVFWTFVGLENLEQLDRNVIRDGMEVWGRVFYSEDPTALTVEKEGLSVFHFDQIKDLTALEILENGIETRLVCNRIRSQ